METFKFFKIKLLTLSLLITPLLYSQNIDWDHDLNTYASFLEDKHIDLYNKISKEDFLKELEKIKTISKTETDFNVIVELMKLTRQIGDGHTAVSLRNLKTHQYPFTLKFIENKWRVIKVSQAHNEILKASLVKIDGLPISEITSIISKVAQFVENQHSEIVRTGQYLTISELLYALNITKSKHKAVFTFIDDQENEIELALDALDSESIEKENFSELNLNVPEISKPEKPMFDYLWHASIKSTEAVYVNFESYPSFEEMQLFGEELVNYIAKNNLKNVVIDMRNNGGGDLYVGVVLAYALNLADSIDWKNGVYVLCSEVTFSAATSNVALFKQLLNAKIVGQPTGSNPTGYQDMDQFELPSSKLFISYSKRKFKLSEKIVQGVQPDILSNYNWDDYKNNKDTMINKLIKDLKQ